jgi:hypothetical protein
VQNAMLKNKFEALSAFKEKIVASGKISRALQRIGIRTIRER